MLIAEHDRVEDNTPVNVHDVIERKDPSLMPGKPLECLNVERSLVLKSGDVFIATFPKTGTTLLQYMCHLLRAQGEDVDFDDIHQVCPHISSSWFIGQELNDSAAIHNAFNPRLFKSHRELEQIAAFSTGVKFIATIRNPINTLYSMYSFRNYRGSTSNCSLLEFASSSMWTTAKLPGCTKTIFDHIVTLWKCRSCSNLLVVPYEDLIESPVSIIPIVAAFMNVPCTPELVSSVAERTSRESMLTQASKFDESWCGAKMTELGRSNSNIGSNNASKVSAVETITVKYSGSNEESAKVKELQDTLWSEKVAPITGQSSYEELRVEMVKILMSR